MSLTSSCDRSGRRRSHSTPRKQSKTGSKSHNLNSSIDSTYSLLSPIYHDSFESSDEDLALEQDVTTDRSREEEPRSPDCQDNGTHSKASELSQQELNLTPWETWIICKEKQMRIELEKKLSEKLKQEEERLKLQQEKEMKKLLAEEQHKQWVQKKLEQEKKEKEQQLLRAQRKKELEEMQKMTIQEKSREKYQEWLRKKKEEEQERKRKEKEEEEKRLAEQKEKREKAEMTFKEWVERAKTRPRAPLNSYGYANGKLTGYYDGCSYPAPGFYNPVPWKPIHVPPPQKEGAQDPSRKKKKKPASSQLYRPNSVPPCKPKDNLRVGGGLFKR